MTVDRDPLLGEWACLGILYDEPGHGWAVVRHLRPDGSVGRVWTLSPPLTYRALDQLTARGWIRPVALEPGDGGPDRTILAATRTGRARFRTWIDTPVPHLRDLRSELLLKLVFAEQHHLDTADLLERQRSIIDHQAAQLIETSGPEAGNDVVTLWRMEATRAAQRFLDQVSTSRPPSRSSTAGATE
jgi:PadR family transcriptional regulator AphA